MRRGTFSSWWGAGLLSLWLLLLTLGAFTCAMVARPGLALGQSEKEPGEKASADERTAEKTGAAKPSGQEENLLQWLYHTLTLRYVLIFLFITFNLVALVVMNILAVWRDHVLPPGLIQAFESSLTEKRIPEAYSLAKNDGSFLGQVLAAGMAKFPSGYDAAVAAMQEVGEQESMRMEQRLSYIALIAQIAPMFGLLGTVDGMVMAFDVIAKSNVTPKPSELAQGIGTALVTTVVGLWIAIPSIAFHHIIRNRMTRLIAEAGIVSEDLMKRFASMVGTAKKG